MSSTSTSYLTFLAAVIGNAIAITLGAIISLATPFVLLYSLREFSAPLSLSPQVNKEEAEKAKDSHQSSWSAATVITAPVALLGYITTGYSHYRQLGSVSEGVLRGTMLVVGASVGVAACLAAVIGLARWFSRPEGGVDAEKIKDAKDG